MVDKKSTEVVSDETRFAAYVDVYINLDTLLWHNIATLLGITVLGFGAVGTLAKERMAIGPASPSDTIAVTLVFIVVLYTNTLFTFMRIRSNHCRIAENIAELDKDGYFDYRKKSSLNGWMSAPRWTVVSFSIITLASLVAAVYYATI